jgi:hypothetical protein
MSKLPRRALIPFLLAYAAASLVHHVHNAELINEYPYMPAWLSRAGVYSAWFGVTAIGITGYVLMRSQYRVVGLIVLAVYGFFGLYGLAHYAIAPVSAHTFAMSLTIWLEVVTAILLLMALARFAWRLSRAQHAVARR